MLGAIAGVAGAALWFVGTSFIAPTLPVQNATSTSPINATASGAVSVFDQGAGSNVLIASVTVPPPGVWVAVRETNSAGELGNVLGAARARGPISNLVVELLRPTEPGRMYAAELYRAEGSDAFDPNVESVYVDFDSGQRVVAFFTTN